MVTPTLLLLTALTVHAKDLKKAQVQYPRVRDAYAKREVPVRALFRKAGIAYPPQQIFLRAFKKEDLLELWARSDGDTFQKVKDYAICAKSGFLGPKRKEGDRQVPEGFYEISRFNPTSQYHLSLKVSYPNASDTVLGKKGSLGGDIFIHGDCVTIGCLPLTDDYIEELYVIAVDSAASGEAMPVHLFPTRLDEAGMKLLKANHMRDPALYAFWENLKPGYDYFEAKRRLPPIRIDDKGRYVWGVD